MLWALTSYFNPQRYARRLANYRAFRARLDVPLLTVELGFDDHFELAPGDADILIRIGRGDVLWQKERLLNIGLDHLPAECATVLCMDCDILCEDPAWLGRIRRGLREHALLQAFAVVAHCAPAPVGAAGAAGAILFSQPALAASPDPRQALQRVTTRSAASAAAGHAWAFRRDFIARHRFFDACIVGGGDTALAGAAWDAADAVIALHRMNAAQAARYGAWAKPFAAALGGAVGFADNRILHLWHGEFGARQAHARHDLLVQHAFDPARDLRGHCGEAWMWDSQKPALHAEVRAYFAKRREDD